MTTLELQPHVLSDSDALLSHAEIARFDTFGYLVLRGRFAQDADLLSYGCEEVLREAALKVVPCQQFYAPAPSCEDHPRIALFNGIDRSPSLAWLKTDDRVVAVVDQLLGPDWVSNNSVNVFNCDTHWHDDSIWSSAGRHIQFMWYLDRLDASNGASGSFPGRTIPARSATSFERR